ncbi:helix-turn-helix domain-containing protein [Nocardia australiensis]|uniref:helix-turn-helix domain-containing protein n=1 Tax=Nocardia australiensis TaxID=2887191 RepID=UPI001D15535F
MPPGSVFTVLEHHGGIAPAVRVARAGQLTGQERETISRGISAGQSFRTIAASLGRPASTVSREVERTAAEPNTVRSRRRCVPTISAAARNSLSWTATMCCASWWSVEPPARSPPSSIARPVI